MTIDLEYFEGRAAWKLDLEQPESFRSVELRLRVRLFRPRHGAVFASWLRLYDLPDRPYSIHRVLDISDSACQRWLGAAAREGAIELLLPGYRRTLSVEEFHIAELVELAQIHIGQQKAPDGDAALQSFLGVFNAAQKERYDVERAWKRVEESLALPPPPPISSGSLDLQGLMQAAENHFTDGDLSAALMKLGLAINIAPERSMPWWLRAQVRLKQRDWQGACDDLNRVVALDANDGWAQHQRALCDLRLIAGRVTWTGKRLGKSLGELVGSAVKARGTLVGPIAVERRELGWAVMLLGLFALSRAFADSKRSDRAVVAALIAEVAGEDQLDPFLQSTLPSMEWLGRASDVPLALLQHVARDLAGDKRVLRSLGDVYTDLYDAGADVLGAANATRDDHVH
jgi:hypothetical protein